MFLDVPGVRHAMCVQKCTRPIFVRSVECVSFAKPICQLGAFGQSSPPQSLCPALVRSAAAHSLIYVARPPRTPSPPLCPFRSNSQCRKCINCATECGVEHLHVAARTCWNSNTLALFCRRVLVLRLIFVCFACYLLSVISVMRVSVRMSELCK